MQNKNKCINFACTEYNLFTYILITIADLIITSFSGSFLLNILWNTRYVILYKQA